MTSYVYDDAGQLTHVLQPEPVGGEEVYSYDDRGLLSAYTDPAGSQYSFTYDELDRLVQVDRPLPRDIVQYTYDPTCCGSTGQPSSKIEVLGDRVTSYTHDDLNQLEQLSITIGGALVEEIDYEYDPVGQLIAVDDLDSTIDVTYTDAGRFLTQTVGMDGLATPVTLTYGYDDRGRRTSLTDSLGGSQTYDFDEADRVAGLTIPGYGTLTLTYDAAGRPSQIVRPSGVVTDYTYDPVRGLLFSLTHASPTETFADWSYGYDPRGNLANRVSSGETTLFEHDALQRLTSVEGPGVSEFYEFDAIGNRTASHLSASYTYDAGHRLLAEQKGVYSYDDFGNVVSIVQGAESTSLGFDPADHVTSITRDGTTVTFDYDGLGRRIKRSQDGVSTWFVHAGSDAIMELDDSGVVLRRTYSTDQDEQPSVSSSSGVFADLHRDRIDSLRLETSAPGGEVISSWTFGVWGDQTSGGASDRPAQFAFGVVEVGGGVLFAGGRVLNESTGRFLNGAAGLSSSLNPYDYANSSPLDRVVRRRSSTGSTLSRAERAATHGSDVVFGSLSNLDRSGFLSGWDVIGGVGAARTGDFASVAFGRSRLGTMLGPGTVALVGCSSEPAPSPTPLPSPSPSASPSLPGVHDGPCEQAKEKLRACLMDPTKTSLECNRFRTLKFECCFPDGPTPDCRL